jgi:hypothetical protein
VSETQGYKVSKEFTLPTECAPLVRELFEERLEAVGAVLDDPEVEQAFNRHEITAMMFERLQLAKMIRNLPISAFGGKRA